MPLAQVSCRVDTVEPPAGLGRLLGLTARSKAERVDVRSLHFTDGVTRTIWLLTNGASHFPVECSTQNAPLLQNLVGTVGTRYCTVDQLVPVTGYEA